MIKMMIVDDEAIVRRGIKTSINWSSYGIKIAGEASNGKNALEQIIKIKPEILITDIKMPITNGLELAAAIRGNHLATKIIILSGYDNFSYAQESIRLKVENYLLKPFGAEELIEVVLKIKKQIMSKRNADNKQKYQKNLIKNNLKLLQDKLIEKIFSGKIDNYQEFKLKALKLDLNLSGPFYQLFILEIDSFNLVTEKMTDDQKDILIKTWQKYTQINLNKLNLTGEINLKHYNHLVVILNLKYKTKINIKTLRKLKNKVQQKLNLSISCSFSEAADLKSLTNFYAEAKLALQKKLYLGKGKIISCHNLPNNKINFPADQEQYFLEELRLANKNSINNLLKKIFLEFTAVQASYANIKDIVLRIISLARAVMEELTTELEVELIYTDFYSEIDKYETIIEIKNWLGGLLNKFIDIIIEKREKQYSKSTKKAITYLKNNYQTTITLDNIAAELYLSPNYFSKIFKLETGKNFTNWLNEYRIKKAKTIIQKEKSIKCYQLASRVGFNDYKYFSTTFKKYVKLSPSQYQQKINLN